MDWPLFCGIYGGVLVLFAIAIYIATIIDDEHRE